MAVIASPRALIIPLLLLAPGRCPGPALGQPSPPSLSIDDAVRLAIRQNPRLSAAAREVVAARAGVRSARALANPELVFTPAITRGGSDQELLLSQPLELNGTRSARTGIASAQLRQAQSEATVELRSLVFDTKAAYHDLARARERRALALEVLQIAAEFDRITRRQVEIGTRPGIDQTQTGIELVRARQQVTLAESEASVALAALDTLMGRPPAEPVGPAESGDDEAAVRQALSARAEITAEEARRDTFQQEARLARAQGRPDLAPQFRADDVVRGLNGYGVGIGVALPLLDYGSRRNRVRQADAAARAQEDRVAAARNQVRQEVEQAVTKLHAATAVIREYRQGVLDQARRLLEGSRTGFRAGLTSTVAVLEAQRTYRAVLSDYTDALVAHAKARAELERATGAFPADLLPPLAADEGKSR
jgi:cobalt-zinc-cadmium efflux system outer membrane protein